MRSLIDIFDLSVEEVGALLDTADDIIANPAKYSTACHGKKIATLFFEPSTRTRLSFEAAMLELGGSVLGFEAGGNSSSSKGESVADTARVVSCYADIIAMRHPLAGSAYVASKNASIPVINAGDGSHSHPTQTLADLCTIRRHKHKFDGLTVGFCGDLKYGRTVHSLIQALSRYTGIKIVLISPKELKLPEYVKNETIKANGMEYYETESMTEVIGELDVLYMTRIQHERFASEEEYLRLKDSYVLDTAKMELAKSDLIVLHPLPRVNEISTAVDKDPRACYFEQVLNAKYMRMALILKLLAEKDIEIPEESAEYRTDLTCDNKGCIVTTEQELPHLFRKGIDGKYRCLYCEHRE